MNKDIQNSSENLAIKGFKVLIGAPAKAMGTSAINIMAENNNDIQDFSRMYGFAWMLLAAVGLWSSYNAGAADFSVLYGNYFNTKPDPAEAWRYGFAIACFIQLTILVPSGILAKILVYRLWKEHKRHITQALYLSPILLFGLTWSTRLSLNMDQAVRAESSGKFDGIINDYRSVLLEKDSSTYRMEKMKRQNFIQDSVIVQNAQSNDENLAYARYKQVRDSLNNRRSYLLRLYDSERGAGWMKGQADKIQRVHLPNNKSNYNLAVNQIRARYSSTLFEKKDTISRVFLADKEVKDSAHAFISSQLAAKLAMLEEDVEFSTKKKMAMSIMFNLLSLIIVTGLNFTYKEINISTSQRTQPLRQSSTAASATIPVSQARTPKAKQPKKPSAPSSDTNADTMLIMADIDKKKRYIRTYYVRCFTKADLKQLKLNPDRGSASRQTAERNQAKVVQMAEELESFGVSTHIDFNCYQEPEFEPIKN